MKFKTKLRNERRNKIKTKLKDEGKKVGALSIDYEETIGVNSRVQLAEAEEILRRRINRRYFIKGC